MRKTIKTRCVCSDPGCPAHKGISGCPNGKATSLLCRVDMTSGVYDMPMCDACADDALESGVFDSIPMPRR